jgi:hypothetical protein
MLMRRVLAQAARLARRLYPPQVARVSRDICRFRCICTRVCGHIPSSINIQTTPQARPVFRELDGVKPSSARLARNTKRGELVGVSHRSRVAVGRRASTGHDFHKVQCPARGLASRTRVSDRGGPSESGPRPRQRDPFADAVSTHFGPIDSYQFYTEYCPLPTDTVPDRLCILATFV